MPQSPHLTVSKKPPKDKGKDYYKRRTDGGEGKSTGEEIIRMLFLIPLKPCCFVAAGEHHQRNHQSNHAAHVLALK